MELSDTESEQLLTLVRDVEPGIHTNLDLTHFLLKKGFSISDLVRVSGFSMASFYNWIGDGFVPNRVARALHKTFWMQHSQDIEGLRQKGAQGYVKKSLQDAKKAQQRAAIVERIKTQAPAWASYVSQPEHLLDLMSPVPSKKSGAPPEALTEWLYHNTEASVHDIEKALKVINSKPELQATLLENYLRLRGLLGDTYDPKISLRSNLTREGQKLFEVLSSENPRTPPVKIIDVYDLLMQHAPNQESKNKKGIRLTELGQILGIPPPTIAGWPAEHSLIPPHYYLQVMSIFNALKNKDPVALRRWTALAETRIQELLALDWNMSLRTQL